MIEKIGLSQYIKIEEKTKVEQDRKKEEVRKEPPPPPQEADARAEISREAKHAQEVDKFTEMAARMPAVDEKKVEDFKIQVAEPNYLKNLARSVSEKIAERIIQSIDMRFGSSDE